MGVGNGDKWDSFEVPQDPVKLEVISVGPLSLDAVDGWQTSDQTDPFITPVAEGRIMPRLASRRTGLSGVLLSLIPVIAATLWFPALAGQAQNVPNPGAEKPPLLLSGLGSHSHRISTQNPEAQKF